MKYVLELHSQVVTIAACSLANFSPAGIPRDMGQTEARQTPNMGRYGENSPMNMLSKEGAEIRHLLHTYSVHDHEVSAMISM